MPVKNAEGSLVLMIQTYLVDNPGYHRPAAIAEHLDDVTTHQVATALNYLAREGRVARKVQQSGRLKKSEYAQAQPPSPKE